MIEKFEHFEKPILEAFAAQLPGISTILLAQIESIMECEREFTGCGPISTFILKENCPVFEPDTDLSPVSYSLTDIEFLSAWHGGIGSDIERSPLTGRRRAG